MSECKKIRDNNLVQLVAEDQSFEVETEILLKSSLYFRAAYQSGMFESQTNHFVFSQFTGNQLDIIVKFFRSELISWDEDYLSDVLKCSEFSKLAEALESLEVADYLQVSVFIQICVNRISSILSILFQPDSIQCHIVHGCNIFSYFLQEFTKVVYCDNVLLKKMFSNYALSYPDPVFKPSFFDSNVLPQIINLTISYLSSSKISVSSEDVILNFVLDWINQLQNTTYFSVYLNDFLHCIRPGLLSLFGKRKLQDFWKSCCLGFKWFNFISFDKMDEFFQSFPVHGILPNDHVFSAFEERYLLTPRVDSVCLLSLVMNRSNSPEFWIFNLQDGVYHKFPVSPSCLSALGMDYFGSDNLDRHIYFCPLSNYTGVDQSSMFVLSVDENNRVLNGFLWCLATGEGRVIPKLLLSTTENADISFGSCFYSGRIGLVTLSTGLYLYYMKSSEKVTWLCLFYFDVSTWSWEEFEPYLLYYNQDCTILFTPIEQINANPSNDWLYANIEIISSNTSGFPDRFQGLNKPSSVHSVFFRFRPCYSTNKINVEHLPKPPFLIRLYRLLVIDVALKDQNSEKQTYLFPVGTCSRDHMATQYYYNVNLRQWLRWSSLEDIKKTSDSCDLTINLCSKILGFRGLFCATHLLDYLDEFRSTDDSLLVNCSENMNFQNRVYKIPSYIKTLRGQNSLISLVLIGRPDETKHVASGIWFHVPALKDQSNITIFDSKKPNLMVPTAVTQTLGQLSLPALVILANWNNLIKSSDPIHFIRTNSSTVNDGVSFTESVFKDNNLHLCDSD